MAGAAAPPLFSTGLDPLVLSFARGPVAVATYVLGSRLGIVVTLLSGSFYPIFWTRFARLRAIGDPGAMRALWRRELMLIAGGSSAIAGVFFIVAPLGGRIVGAHRIATPELLYAGIAVLGVLTSAQAVTLAMLGGQVTSRWTASMVYGFILPNEGLSYVLSRLYGAPGPILASVAFTGLTLMVCWWIIAQKPETLCASLPAG